MGRQAHLTRLALGRSPYGDPIRDENGDFVMSSRVGIYSNNDYKQDFDDRGHPRNNESALALRRFWRAQNNVLAAVGVVARRGIAQKSDWEMLEVKEKSRHVMRENEEGKLLKGADRVLGAIALWPLTALRRRIMTFDPYYGTSLAHQIGNEVTWIGFRSFMTAGLPTYLLSFPPQLYRHYVREPDVEDIVNYVDPSKYTLGIYEKCTFALVHIPCFVLEVPVQVYAILQSLFVIRTDIFINLSFFIPFTKASPISLPPIPNIRSFTSLSAFIFGFVQTPLVLSMIREHLHVQIGYRLYALFRQTLIRPEHPDGLSAKASDEKEDLDDTSIPGVGRMRSTEDMVRPGRYFGPRSFLGALRIAFPLVYKVLDFLSRGKLSISRGRLDIESEERLQIQVRSAYCGRLRLTGEAPTPSSIADIALRREVMYTVFSASSLDPDEELVDPYAWADAVLQDVVTLSSNSTPNPQDLFDFAEIIRDEARNLTVPNGTANHQGTQRTTDVITSIEVELLPDSTAEQAALQITRDENQSHDSSEAINSHGGRQTQIEEGIIDDTIVNVVETTLSGSSYANATPLLHGDASLNSIAQSANTINEIEAAHTLSLDEATQNHITTSIDSTESEQPPSQVPEPDSNPQTPVQGISRAASLIDPDLTARPRRLRRPTEINSSEHQDLLADFNENFHPETFSSVPYPASDSDAGERSYPIRHNSLPHSSSRNHSRYNRLLGPERREWRVTLLSTFAADSLAWHGSAIITSFILWPIESLYVRSITTWFLNNPALADYVDNKGTLGPISTMFGGGLRVFGLQEWFGGSGGTAVNSVSRLQYMGSILLVLGLESMGRGLLWYLGTRSALRKGMHFGWGKF